jgi:hypothetical protein
VDVSAAVAERRFTQLLLGLFVGRSEEIQSQRAGSLELNETVDIPVESGHHTVQVRSGRNSSRTKAFDVAEGEIASFRCSGKSILPIFLLSFVVPSLALSLNRE